MDAHEFKKLNREARVETALWPSDLEEVIRATNALEKISGIDGEVVCYRDDGEELAVVWRDSESEKWLINWLRGSGA